MGVVGMRELKENTSALIRRVIAGETIEVTQRGRPVARIVPIEGPSVLDRMVAERRAAPAHGDLLDVKPHAQISGKRPLSEVLAGMRDVER
jgi:prevent-host-death family protein